MEDKMDITNITTERLIIRRFRQDDWPDLFEYLYENYSENANLSEAAYFYYAVKYNKYDLTDLLSKGDVSAINLEKHENLKYYNLISY